jgi:hypothetical protein
MSEVNEPVVIRSVEEFERAYGPRSSLADLLVVMLGPEPPPWWTRLARRLLRRPEPAPLVVTRVLGPND